MGRPLGAKRFVQRLERRLGRPRLPRKRTLNEDRKGQGIGMQVSEFAEFLGTGRMPSPDLVKRTPTSNQLPDMPNPSSPPIRFSA